MSTEPQNPVLELLKSQVERGERVRARVPHPVGDFAMWIEAVRHHLFRIYGTNSPQIDALFPKPNPKEMSGKDLRPYGEEIAQRLDNLITYFERIELLKTRARSDRVFVGHGRSNDWLKLKDFLATRLQLPVDEFNQEAAAGLSTIQRLENMLATTGFAFLVMTAEDEGADSKMRARPNVIHETGLFQGRLGFDRAIILLEQGCEEFSNIHGLTQLRFPPGDIGARFEDVRRVLEDRGVLER
jgi:hypothetical protein